MRFAFVLSAVFLTLALQAAESNPPLRSRGKLTPEQLQARRAERARRMYETTGGVILRERTGNVVRIVSTTDKIDLGSIDVGMQPFRSSLNLPLEVVKRPADGNPKNYLEENVGFVVVLSDNADTPVLLVAPEEKWASVNVGKLGADGIDAEKLVQRTIKEIWRASAFALGAGYTNEQPDLMGPIYSIRELDEMGANAPSPACYNMMIGVAQRLGIEQTQMTTYRQACQEGWAPAPTNAIQQAIWDKVHAMPQNPMKIEFDPKKGR